MGLLRGLNLLQGVEGQTVLSAALESILAGSPAQKAEFGAMLSTRHMARRMAGNAITMTAINASEKAIEIVFEQTTELNAEPIKEIAKNSAAMLNTSTVLSSLNKVLDNDAAFVHYSASAFYESNIVNTLATLIGRDPNIYANISALILDSAAMGDISTNIRAMKAVVMSSPAMTVVTSNSLPMIDIASNTDAMTIVANSSLSMHLIAQSQTALDEVTDDARTLVVSVPSAVLILASYEDAWDYIMHTSTTLAANIYNLLIIFSEVDYTTHTSVTQIFNNSVASLKIANSRAAMIAAIHDSASMTTLIASPNLETIFTASIAMNQISQHPEAIIPISADATAWSLYLASPLFALNLKDAVATLAGLVYSDYANITAIFANETASLAIAGNQSAMQAILSDSDSVAILIASDNLDTVLGESVAMTEIAGSESTMNTLMSNSVAFPIVLTSALAKAAIFASPTLLATMLTPGSDSLATVSATAQTQVGPTPDTNIGSFQSLGLSGNVIILTAVMGSIVGTLLDNYFKGDTGPTDTVACPGVQAVVPPTAVNKGYTNVVWDVNSIAATAAAKVTVTYVDFN
jgi:hypothetical protein